ncbi:MmgE/PrpD family protein [Desulfotignum balticum]|uniref:MmgE/PrpD family protein n=1 Tax=Desulfotignum balticum TaxID=115781 RepID=UPI000421D312|nr:MmgE/PrpD family protein [Desulfotignum balticum]
MTEKKITDNHSAENLISEFVETLSHDQIPESALNVARQIILAVSGTAVAGAGEDGCRPLYEMLKEQGGKPEATVMVYGDKLPAPGVAMLNGFMCRALDFCDAMAPGLHMGSSLIPSALAAAEIMGGCSGKAFITAVVVGAEIGARFNLTEQTYDGFDPTGVAGVFASTAVAARILGLTQEQITNSLALAFNRCGGSFQSNVDGSLAVRLIQGWVAAAGLECAVLAKLGFTGPANYIDGIYGYLHLFAKDVINSTDLTEKLGERYLLENTVFKKYPSCGLTQGITELALNLVTEHNLEPDHIESVEVILPPYAYRLVGHEFEMGRNVRVNAQFSVQFCAANAIVRRSSNLSHFSEESVRSPELQPIIEKIKIKSDPDLNFRSHTAVDFSVLTIDGKKYTSQLDVAPGFPGNPLTDNDHISHFSQCMDYAQIPLHPNQAELLFKNIMSIENVEDIRLMLDTLKARGNCS